MAKYQNIWHLGSAQHTCRFAKKLQDDRPVTARDLLSWLSLPMYPVTLACNYAEVTARSFDESTQRLGDTTHSVSKRPNAFLLLGEVLLA